MCSPATKTLVSRFSPVDVTVYPYECDAYGHLNEAGFLQLFERARWETLARGPGVDLFSRNGVWPAVRRAVVDYHRPAFPADVLRVEVVVEKVGRTSLEMRQRAAAAKDGALVAELHIVFVMIDKSGKPTPMPDEVSSAFGGRVTVPTGEIVRYGVGDVTLAVESRGDGPALLLIHGFPLDRSMWGHQVATLARWRRIAPDLRGCGFSDAPEQGYSMAAYASDLVGLLDKLRIERAVIAGLSMGGYVAFELLRRHRERVMGLILMDTRADADTPDGRRGRDALIEVARSQGAAAVGEHLLPRLLGRSTQRTQPQVVEQVREMARRTPVPGIVGALTAMRDRPDSTPNLGAIDVPTLVVVGEEDELTPPALARAMTSAIPLAAMTTIPGAGHLAPLEAPTAVSRVIAEFLEAVPKP
jgi:YbgC/YbaW family acyl-CoA thioester hydrolase